jgi:hypothetical protein
MAAAAARPHAVASVGPAAAAAVRAAAAVAESDYRMAEKESGSAAGMITAAEGDSDMELVGPWEQLQRKQKD